MEKINWICKSTTVNNNIVWACHPKIKEHFEATPNTVQLFSATNYGGNSSSFGIGRYTSTQLDKIGPKALQSIKVPSGLVALLYQNADFTGYGKAISADTPDLSQVTDTKNTGFNWSNQMQSLIVQPYVALPTSISDKMPKISLVAPDSNSFITAVSGAVLTRIDDKSYLYVDPNNKDNLFWYNAGDLQVIPPFSMANISGIRLWLDGSDPAGNGTPPADGTKVTTWTDKSSNKFNTTNVGGNPTYNAATKSIKFDGGSSYNLPNGSLPYNNSPYSIFIIVSTVNPGPPGWYLSGGGGQVLGSAFNANQLSHSWANGGSELWRPGPVRPITSNKPVIVLLSYDSSNRMLTLDGTLAGSDKAGVINNDQNRNIIGYSPVYGQNLNGNIYEILVFNDYLSDPQRQIIEGYLAWKWDLQSNLPDNHPFKSAAPSGSVSFPKILVTSFGIVSALPKGNWASAALSNDGKIIVELDRDNSVWLSKDSGSTWNEINKNKKSWQFSAMNSDGSFIIVNANNGYGTWYTTDMGNNWTKANVAAPTYPGAIACSLDGSKIYMADQGSNEVWKSTDRGKNWSSLINGKFRGAWNYVCCSDDGSIVAAVTYRLNTNGYIYISTDGGNNWIEKTNTNTFWWSIRCSSDGKIMVANTAEGQTLYISKDTGQTWNYQPTPIKVFLYALTLSSDGSTIFIGNGTDSIYVSRDTGANWKKANYSKDSFGIYNSKDNSIVVANSFGGNVNMISS